MLQRSPYVLQCCPCCHLSPHARALSMPFPSSSVRIYGSDCLLYHGSGNTYHPCRRQPHSSDNLSCSYRCGATLPTRSRILRGTLPAVSLRPAEQSWLQITHVMSCCCYCWSRHSAVHLCIGTGYFTWVAQILGSKHRFPTSPNGRNLLYTLMSSTHQIMSTRSTDWHVQHLQQCDNHVTT